MLSFSSLFLEVAALGLSGIVVKEVVKRNKIVPLLLGSTFTARFLIGLLLSTVAFLAAQILEFENQNVPWLILFFSFGLSFKGFEAIDLWYQAKQENFYPVICRITSISLVLGLVLFGLSMDFKVSYFIITAALEFIFSAVFYVYIYKFEAIKEWEFDRRVLKGLLNKSWPLILSAIGFIIYRRIDQVMLGQMVGSSDVGIYAVASKLSEAWYYLPIAITRAYFPKLVSQKENENFKESLQQLYDVLCSLGYLVALGVTLVGPFIITFFYGPSYDASKTVLIIHIWACVFIFMREGLSKWLIIEDLYIFSLVTHGLGAVSNVIINFMLIPYWGAIGAAIATVISYAMASYFSLMFSKRTWPVMKMMTRSLINPLRGLVIIAKKLL